MGYVVVQIKTYSRTRRYQKDNNDQWKWSFNMGDIQIWQYWNLLRNHLNWETDPENDSDHMRIYAYRSNPPCFKDVYEIKQPRLAGVDNCLNYFFTYKGTAIRIFAHAFIDVNPIKLCYIMHDILATFPFESHSSRDSKFNKATICYSSYFTWSLAECGSIWRLIWDMW